LSPPTHPYRSFAAFALLALILLPATAFAAAPAAPSDVAPITQAVDPDLLAGLFAPDPIEVIVGTVQGPCTLNYQCSAACGGELISCSGGTVCHMYYGPRYPGCAANVYVQCDNQPAIYCVGGPL
jgi:hypothetical protein